MDEKALLEWKEGTLYEYYKHYRLYPKQTSTKGKLWGNKGYTSYKKIL